MEKDEAEQTVRKNAQGAYYDLAKDSLTKKGKANLTDVEMNDLFAKVRVRYSLTPQCNLWCMFCSNEGSNYAAKKRSHADINMVISLSEMLLKNTPLNSIDFSGGEPTVHPDFTQKEYKLIEWTKKYKDTRFSLHTNGINLNPEIIDLISDNFSRIGVSINSPNFETWDRISNGFGQYNAESQMKKFGRMMENLEYLSQKGIGNKVFLKTVIMRGINDSEEELKAFFELSEKYGFHPKLLQFEAQYKSQKHLEVPRSELFPKLEKIGCTFQEVPLFTNEQACYFPNVNFQYNKSEKAKLGLHSMFGCGLEGACMACYDYLCMFVKPTSNGNGLYLKPCSVLDTRLDLTHAIKTGNFPQIFSLFKMSREYLMLAPGLGTCDWNKETEFDKK